LREAISLVLCFCVIFATLAYSSPSELANQNANANPEQNVITASDAGGGDLTRKEIVYAALIFGAVMFLLSFLPILIW
jgi:TRAP-type C4-dicarboxylate transport system permease small subunit